jgi:hypothetical protein
MANIVECPICDSRFDVTKLPEGSKVKCSKCQKVVGKLVAGALVPILESVKKSSPTVKQPVIYSDEGDDYEEVVVRRRVTRGMAAADAAIQETRPSLLARDPAELLLAVAGVVGLCAIATLAYAIFKYSQPPMVRTLDWNRSPAAYGNPPPTTPPESPITK